MIRASLLLMTGLFGLVAGASAGPGDPLKQGLVDLLLEYMDARYPGRPQAEHLLYVSVHRQELIHVRSGRSVAVYPISTAKAGLGSEQDSYRTPTGLHCVSEKFGEGVPPFGILRDREFNGQFAAPDENGDGKDWITSRILWLEGLEPGLNQGPLIDSKDRYIYIHGTASEIGIGKATSMGCIRMRNADVIELFDEVPVGSLVVILDN